MTSEDYGSLNQNVLRFLANYLTRFAVAAIVVYSCWIPIQNYNYWFSWHVILCTCGYLPLMSESLMVFTGDELWSRQVSRKTKYMVHGTLIFVGTAITIAGNGLIFYYTLPGYHLYTAHGITGLISMIIVILSLALGYVVYYAKQLQDYVKITPIWLKFIHNFVGLLGYTIGVASLCFGYYTKWFVYYTTEESRLAALIVTIIAYFWTINGAVVSLYVQVKTIYL